MSSTSQSQPWMNQAGRLRQQLFPNDPANSLNGTGAAGALGAGGGLGSSGLGGSTMAGQAIGSMSSTDQAQQLQQSLTAAHQHRPSALSQTSSLSPPQLPNVGGATSTAQQMGFGESSRGFVSGGNSAYTSTGNAMGVTPYPNYNPVTGCVGGAGCK